MNKIFTTMTLALVFATSAFANGKVTFVNHANGGIKVWAYDWDDVARSISHSQTTIGAGSTGSVTCKKNWVDSNAPGCYITMHTQSYDEPFIRQVKYRNGSYIVKGAWRYTGQPPITFDTQPTVTEVAASHAVIIPKLQLPTSGGGTAECISKGTAVNLAWNEYMSLRWQSDGNLVVRDPHGFQWTSGTASDATKLCFQGDGNLVIYRSSHDPWTTGTAPNGASLRLLKDCNVVVKASGGTTLWQTHTHCRP